MLLLVCYILCNLNYNPLKSSINLVNKAKEKKILEVYSCNFPGCFKLESYHCSPEKLLIPMLVQTQAFTKQGPGTDLRQTEISFKPDLCQSFGTNTDTEYTGKSYSVSPWAIQKDSPLGTVAPCRFASALRALSQYTLQNTACFHKDAILFPGGVLLSPSHTQSFPRS